MNGHSTTLHRGALIGGLVYAFGWSCTCGARCDVGYGQVIDAEAAARIHELQRPVKAPGAPTSAV